MHRKPLTTAALTLALLLGLVVVTVQAPAFAVADETTPAPAAEQAGDGQQGEDPEGDRYRDVGDRGNLREELRAARREGRCGQLA